MLEVILSAHVDDLKGGAPKPLVDKLRKHLEAEFGPCKAEFNNFVHTGIQHLKTARGIFCDQYKFISELGQMDVSSIRSRRDDELANEQMWLSTFRRSRDVATNHALQTVVDSTWPYVTSSISALAFSTASSRSHGD